MTLNAFLKLSSAELAAMRRDQPQDFARLAIAKLQAGMTGRASFDSWRHYAIRQWRDFLTAS